MMVVSWGLAFPEQVPRVLTPPDSIGVGAVSNSLLEIWVFLTAPYPGRDKTGGSCPTTFKLEKPASKKPPITETWARLGTPPMVAPN